MLCDEKGEVRLDMISKYGNQELMIRNLLDDYALPNKKGPKSIVLNITGSGDKIILMNWKQGLVIWIRKVWLGKKHSI